MRTTTINFDRVFAQGTASVACKQCGTKTNKNISDWCSINPFNKNDAGEVCSREEVRQQARKKVDQMVVRATEEGRICGKCRVASAEPYEHINAEGPLIADSNNLASEYLDIYQEILGRLKEMWLNKDVEVWTNKEWRRGIVTDVYLASHGGVGLGVKVYSKARYAVPGEVLFDTVYVNTAGTHSVRLISAKEEIAA